MKTISVPDSFVSHQPDLLVDRVILVTGANGAIGEAVASAGANCGAQLIIAGKTPRKLDRLYDKIVAAGGVEPVILPVDLLGSGPDEYAQVAQAIEDQFGRLDGLVHLASVFKGLNPMSAMNPQDWLETIHVAINAPFLLHQSLLTLLSKSTAARVVFALDDSERTSKAYWGAYGVAKAALRGMVSIIADETEGAGICVNAVIPPPVQSRLRQNLYMSNDPQAPVKPDKVITPWLYLLAADSDPETGAIYVDGALRAG